MMTKAMLATAGFMMMAGAATAQTAPSPDANANTGAPMERTGEVTGTAADQSMNAAGMSSAGFKMAEKAEGEARFMEVQSADMMASRLIGVDVYNANDEELGEIKDIVLRNGSEVAGVVVGVGGYLGFNERNIVIDPSTMALSQKDGVWRARLDASKDKLSNAPEYRYTEKQS